jgi:hypothetical protein
MRRCPGIERRLPLLLPAESVVSPGLCRIGRAGNTRLELVGTGGAPSGTRFAACGQQGFVREVDGEVGAKDGEACNGTAVIWRWS